MEAMKHGSLFSGIGGFDLAAEWMGWENVFHCEKNEFCQRVLRYYWPNAISYEDVTQADFTRHSGQIDILTGGFPCQPYSTAGKRKGKEDDRHLWPAMLRAIREISPRYVVGENVRGLLSWNGGLVFHEVQSDLEAEGYDVLPFLLPACAVNAPHRRDRIWFIAHAKSKQNNGRGPRGFFAKPSGIDAERNASNPSIKNDRRGVRKEGRRQEPESGSGDLSNDDAHTNGQGLPKSIWRKFGGFSEENGSPEGSQFGRDYSEIGRWEDFPTQSPVCNGNDGLPTELDGITISKHRRETIQAGGNAVVPPLVYRIFKAIEETELIITTK